MDSSGSQDMIFNIAFTASIFIPLESDNCIYNQGLEAELVSNYDFYSFIKRVAVFVKNIKENTNTYIEKQLSLSPNDNCPESKQDYVIVDKKLLNQIAWQPLTLN